MSDAQVLVENVMNALVTGVLIGCIYGLMCVGLGLIFGIMRVVNFAQGELLMLGMYVAYYLFTGWGLLTVLGPYAGPLLSALIAGPVVFAGGALLHRFLISRVSGLRSQASLDEGHFGQLIVTLGVSLILQNGGLIVFGSSPRSVLTPLSSSAWVLDTGIFDSSLFLNKARVVASLVAIVVAIGLYVLLEKTRLGRSLRAAADNPTAATYAGIDVGRAHRIAFGLGSAGFGGGSALATGGNSLGAGWNSEQPLSARNAAPPSRPARRQKVGVEENMGLLFTAKSGGQAIGCVQG